MDQDGGQKGVIHWILDTWWSNRMRGGVDVGGEARKGTLWVFGLSN